MSILHHIALIYSTFININIVIVFEIKLALFIIYKIYFKSDVRYGLNKNDLIIIYCKMWTKWNAYFYAKRNECEKTHKNLERSGKEHENEEEKQNMQNQNDLLQNLFISYIVASDVLW